MSIFCPVGDFLEKKYGNPTVVWCISIKIGKETRVFCSSAWKEELLFDSICSNCSVICFSLCSWFSRLSKICNIYQKEVFSLYIICVSTVFTIVVFIYKIQINIGDSSTDTCYGEPQDTARDCIASYVTLRLLKGKMLTLCVESQVKKSQIKLPITFFHLLVRELYFLELHLILPFWNYCVCSTTE